VKNILSKVAAVYPQSLFYPLNSMIGRLQLIQSTAAPNTLGDPNLTNIAAALQSAESIMSFLRNHHPPLYSDISVIVDEIATNLKPEPEEMLLDNLLGNQ